MKNLMNRTIIVTLTVGLLGPLAYASTHHKKPKSHKHATAVSRSLKNSKVYLAKDAKRPSKPLAKKVAPEPTLAQDEQEASRLHFLALRIDRDTQNIPMDAHVEAVAFQYHVPLSVVEDLQKQGKGWGDVNITLAMANSLSQKDKTHYASTSDAVNRIQFVRATSKDWMSTAHRVGVPLHSTYAMTSRGYSDIVAASRNEQASLPKSFTSEAR